MIKPIVYIRFLLGVIVSTTTANALRVGVFGGSGFIGRRVCRDLVGAGCEVVCLSRSPRPNSADWFQNTNVEWVQYNTSDADSLAIDAAVSCVGNLDPSKKWMGLWGLGWDDDIMWKENGEVNEQICRLAQKAGAKRFVFVSVSFEVAKMLEGPIVGYMNGKRNTEHVACELFGPDNTIVVGPSLVYGGKRFPKGGKFYRSFVESAPAKAYVRSNDALRSLSVGEDWVEKTLFSSPVDVEVVSRVLSAGAMGLIPRDMVGSRRQGFYDTEGLPVTYDDVLYVDGTAEIERIDQLIQLAKNTPSSDVVISAFQNDEPFEGAFIGKRPYLYPLPVIATFSYLFWAVATQQFVQLSGT